jgi:lipopolysaccharide/colanic/teichoic acid biosynthesis glycosyltransferase
VRIKIIPDMYDILAGSVKMTSIFGAPLIEVNPQIMPAWQFAMKRGFDIFGSVLALVLLSPVILVIGILVKLGSPGPVFFRQERIGLWASPSGSSNSAAWWPGRAGRAAAEQCGRPADHPIGRFLRRTRLDELPQFWNVLKGDMSLVVLAPERQHFIDPSWRWPRTTATCTKCARASPAGAR